MKYHCLICGDMCFDDSTDESLPEDIKSHESGWFHKHKANSFDEDQIGQRLRSGSG